MTIKFSPNQIAIFQWIMNEKGHAVIQAVAGAGKTFTLVNALNYIPRSFGDIYFLAFNRDIAKSFKEKIPAHVKGKTFHSLGLSVWAQYITNKYGKEASNALFDRNSEKINSNKVSIIFDNYIKNVSLTKNNPIDFINGVTESYKSFVLSLISYCKYRLVLPNSPENQYEDIIEHFDLHLENEDATTVAAIRLARTVLELSNKEECLIDYDDMLYLPLINQSKVRFPKASWILIDECQDTNPARREFVAKMCNSHTRTIWVGDSFQSIYGFSGADNNSMDIIMSRFKAIMLPLTVSYRCAKSVVEFSRQWANHIEPHENAIDGIVKELPFYNETTFSSNDAILCRNTAPLITMAFSLLKRSIPCQIMGREIGEGLIRLVIQMKAKGVDSLKEKLEAYKIRESEKLIKADKQQAASNIRDKVEAILAIISGMDQNNKTVPKIIAHLESMFVNENETKKNVLTLCTVHRSKGLEWKRVFILDRLELMPSKNVTKDWQYKQEINLCYVAATRAMEELYDIKSGSWKEIKIAA